nr:unnamed protein product [Haemonchus contortus]
MGGPRCDPLGHVEATEFNTQGCVAITFCTRLTCIDLEERELICTQLLAPSGQVDGCPVVRPCADVQTAARHRARCLARERPVPLDTSSN